MPVTAEDARQAVANMNTRKRQFLPKELLQDRPPYFVHNIHDMTWTADLGGLRKWIIPACPQGAKYSTLEVRGLIADEYDTGDGNGSMGVLPVLGSVVAKEIVGVDSPNKELGMFTGNKEWFGVFASPNRVPTEEELSLARQKLTEMMKLLLADGNRRHLEGNSDKPGVGTNSIGAQHRKAAIFLGQNVPWAQAVAEMIDCPGCGERVKPNIIKHVCGYVFDQKRYRENMVDKGK